MKPIAPRNIDRLHEEWGVRLHYGGGWRPWSAFITHGIARVGEAGSTTYSSRTPEGSLRKALRTIAKMAPNEHPEQIRINIDRDESWG